MKYIQNSPIIHQKKYTNSNSTANKKSGKLKATEQEEHFNDPYAKDEFEKDDLDKDDKGSDVQGRQKHLQE